MVEDDKLSGVTYTEPIMNHGISEKELPEKFATQEYQVLLVAEKYQTGFDQPLLHTMFVDKRLAGIQAVQTLSRLNRVHPLKEDTFVLDFVNDREEIQEAFKAYYEGAEMGEKVEPARMYAIKGELDASGIYLDDEVVHFCAVYFKPKRRQSALDHQTINAALDPAVSRFTARRDDDEEKAEDLRSKVQAFLNLLWISEPGNSVSGLGSRADVRVSYATFRRNCHAARADRHIGLMTRWLLSTIAYRRSARGPSCLQDGEARPLDGPTEIGSGLGAPAASAPCRNSSTS